MSETIISESKRNASLISDLDNFRTKSIEIDLDREMSVTYPSYEIFSFEKNLYIMIAKSSVVKFKPEWIMRPDYVSFEYYNNTIYWPVILFVNNVFSIEDFINLEEILVPPMEVIIDLIRDKPPNQKPEKINTFLSNPLLKMYQRKPMDDIEISKLQASDNATSEQPTENPTEKVLQEHTEVITLSALNIQNKYCTLSFIPVNSSSVSLYIDDFNVAQRYGYDYCLKKDTNNDYKLISWKAEDCFGGVGGMESFMEENTKLRIKYIYENEVFV